MLGRLAGIPVVMAHVHVRAAERRQVEVLVGAAEQVDDVEVSGVGAQDGAGVPEEDADPALLTGPGEMGQASVDQFLLALEVPLDGGDRLVVRDVEVVVEVTAQFETLRRPRVEQIVKAAARINNSKAAGPVARIVRDAILPLIFKFAANSKQARRPFDHHIDWDTPISVTTGAQ